ncbi:MAG: hypothetical protein K6F64_06505 [Clostridia bacterium]|nr:hypothetical protein [Clostridia bacterium]
MGFLDTIVALLNLVAGGFGTSADFAVAYGDLTSLIAAILEFLGSFAG